MGTGETVQVAGKGTLVIETKTGRKHIQEVMLVPGLEENLLSVGQMMEHGYCLVFGKGMVTIFDDWSLQNPIAKVPMTSNRCFSLTMVPTTQLVREQVWLTVCRLGIKGWAILMNKASGCWQIKTWFMDCLVWIRILQFVKAASWESSIETHFLQNLLGELSFHLN